MSSIEMNEIQQSGIRTPHDNDVLSGRGNYANRHPGNKRFRAYVSSQRELYAAAPKNEKSIFAKTIVRTIRSLQPPGRFLKRDPNTELWVDIGNRKSLLKTRQALRENPLEIGRTYTETQPAPVNIGNISNPPTYPIGIEVPMYHLDKNQSPRLDSPKRDNGEEKLNIPREVQYWQCSLPNKEVDSETTYTPEYGMFTQMQDKKMLLSDVNPMYGLEEDQKEIVSASMLLLTFKISN